MASEKEWWHPVLSDAEWAQGIRSEGYDDEDKNRDDEEIREEYAAGRKYSVTWDHLGDAHDDWECLADDWLRLRAENEALREALAPLASAEKSQPATGTQTVSRLKWEDVDRASAALADKAKQ